MESFIEKRIEICRNCPIMRMSEWGMKCDDRKWISPDGTEGSFFKKDGWKHGCGCIIATKAKNPSNHCVVNKW